VLKRFLANIIDISVFFGIIVMTYQVIFPSVINVAGSDSEGSVLIAAGLLVFVIALTSALQYPFLKIHQTIGKAFFGLKIISTNDMRPLTVSIIVQRELFAKIMSAYLMCLPVFFGKTGKHDEAAETEVVPK
jgi:uncharacterized RDD family membrane protein YckC